MIDKLLDENGRGILSQELVQIFTHAGCRPSCHICYKFLIQDKPFRLKPFAVEKTEKEQKSSLTIMICAKCDEDEKKLPYGELVKALASLKIIIPSDAKYKPSDYCQAMQKSFDKYVLPLMKLYFKDKSKFDYELSQLEWRKNYRKNFNKDSDIYDEFSDFYRLNPYHDLPFFVENYEYEQGMKKFHKRFEQKLPNETYVERSKRASEEHRAWVKAQPVRRGCFVLTNGNQQTIIPGE